MKTAEVILTLHVIAILALMVGWCMNIVDILQSLDGPIDALFAARLVGFFAAPLGGILGYI